MPIRPIRSENTFFYLTFPLSEAMKDLEPSPFQDPFSQSNSEQPRPQHMQ